MEWMIPSANRWKGIVCLLLSCYFTCRTAAQTSVVTQHNNLKRTGWNNTETQLTQNNISSGRFGKIFSRTVDDQIYAQPLVLSNLSIAGGTHDVVFVATVNNSVYAFDADDSATGTPYWKVNLTYDSTGYRPPTNADMSAQGACYGNYNDFSHNMGIVGTPVIDTVGKTLYVVAKSVVVANGDSTFVQYLHALDITTGAERPNSPVKISATVIRGDGYVINFNPLTQLQRAGLLLQNGVVFICWASYCDMPKFYGWVMGYYAATLAQKYIYNDCLYNASAGIWMSGQAPAVDDSGNIILVTGNGQVGNPVSGDPNDPVSRGESLLKLSTASGQLKVTDFFTPNNYDFLNIHDLDYGTDGAMLIPNTSLSLSGSKEGLMYLINDTAMGGMRTDNSSVRQVLNVNGGGTSFYRNLHGSPVYFQDNNNNEYVYAWASSTSNSPGYLKQYPFLRDSMRFDTLNTVVGNTQLPAGKPGGMLSVSSNGSQAGTGILWASHPINGNANEMTVPGELQAFDATDVTRELWNSNWSAKRDSIGTFAKFVCPTIANGKVYMATFSNMLNVYGLNPPSASVCSSTLPSGWNSADIGYTAFAGDVCDQSGKYTITASGTDVYGSADAFHYYFEPAVSSYLEVKMRVDSIQNTNTFSKCGIMFRSNLDPGAPNMFVGLTPSHGIYIQQRNAQNDTTTLKHITGVPVPSWLRVINDGNLYIVYTSSNGTSWTPVDTVTVSLGSHPYVGLAFTSRDNTFLSTAVVDSFTVAPQDILSTGLVNFTVKNVQNRYAHLTWTQEDDTNVDHFEIERSSSTTDFVKIGSLASRGASKPDDYTFDDIQPLSGFNYYRVMVTYRDGSVKYSNVLTTSFNFDVITLYPNPARGQIFIRNNDHFTDNRNLGVMLSDVSGRIVDRQTISTSGLSIITYQIPAHINQGMYVLWMVNDRGQKQGQKVFIIR